MTLYSHLNIFAPLSCRIRNEGDQGFNSQACFFKFPRRHSARTSFSWITNRSCGALPIFALGEHIYRAALPNSGSCASVIFSAGAPARMVLSLVRECDRASMGSIPETRPQLV